MRDKLQLSSPSLQSHLWNLLKSGRRVTSPNQGLSSGRWETLGTRLLFPEPYTEAYCIRLNFNISKLVYLAAISRESVLVVVRTRPRAIPLAVITMRKSTHGFPFLPHLGMGCHFVVLRVGVLFGPLELNWQLRYYLNRLALWRNMLCHVLTFHGNFADVSIYFLGFTFDCNDLSPL